MEVKQMMQEVQKQNGVGRKEAHKQTQAVSHLNTKTITSMAVSKQVCFTGY